MLVYLWALLFASSAVAAAAPLTVPFDFSRHEIGLNVSVKGKPLYMILDTGVNPSVIDLKRAEALKLPLNRRAAGEGGGESGHSAPAIPSTIQRLSVGGRGFGDIEALATDLGDMSASYGRSLDGVLGYSFIKGDIVLIDYPAHAVTFYDNDASAASALQQCRRRYAVPFVSFGNEGFPVVRDFQIGSISLPATLDTGSSRTIGLYRQALLLEEIRGALNMQGAEAGNSFGGRYTTREALLKVPVAIGPFKAPVGMAASVMPEQGSASARLAKIGNGLLAAMKVKLLLDYAEKRISFFGNCGK